MPFQTLVWTYVHMPCCCRGICRNTLLTHSCTTSFGPRASRGWVRLFGVGAQISSRLTNQKPIVKAKGFSNRPFLYGIFFVLTFLPEFPCTGSSCPLSASGALYVSFFSAFVRVFFGFSPRALTCTFSHLGPATDQTMRREGGV